MILRQIAHTAATKTVALSGRLVLLFVLARTFAPADYGAYSLIMTTATFGVFLLGLNLHSFVYRQVPGADLAARVRVFKSTFVFEVALATAIVLVFLASGALGPVLGSLGARSYRLEFVIGLGLLLCLIAAAEVQHYLWAKLDIEHGNYLDVIAQSSWVLPLVILWLLNGRVSLNQVLLCNIGGVLVAIAYGFRHVEFSEWRQVRPQWQVIRTAMRFSVPLIVPAISFYALKLADRYVLSYYDSLATVGLYSFAYAFFNTIYSFTATIVLNAVLPHVMQAQNRQEFDRRNRLLVAGTKASLVAFTLASATFLAFSREVVQLFARPEYDPSRSVMPLLAAGFVMIIAAYPAHYLLMLADRTRTIMWIELVGLAIAMVMLFVLVPSFSYHGAAIATLVGFAWVAAAKHVSSRSWRSLSPKQLFSFGEDLRALRRLVWKGPTPSLDSSVRDVDAASRATHRP